MSAQHEKETNVMRIKSTIKRFEVSRLVRIAEPYDPALPNKILDLEEM